MQTALGVSPNVLPKRQLLGSGCGELGHPSARHAARGVRRGLPFATAQQATAGYSAADSPEMRKHAALYATIQPPQIQVDVQQQLTSAAVGDAPQTSVVVEVGSSKAVRSSSMLMKPEVLSPAGGWPQLRAAVENGADAVYFGLSDFNARARAANFAPEELPDVMGYLRERGVKGYVVLNVLVFDEELVSMEQRVRQVAAAGVDAVIVQDLGVVALIRRVAPSLAIHGSTQMSITSPEGATFAARAGVDRVVVGRELSTREIGKLRAGTGAEVEAFVHGALCVSYSGQCFSSEAWGGRSANRGQCAQACRMPYGLVVDGQIRDLQDFKYLLSPQDLMAVEQVPDLIRAGVACFKIEGRLKGPEYVALTTQVYRRAIDAAWEAMTGSGQHQGSAGATAQVLDKEAADANAKAAVELSQQQRWALEQVFSRGQDGEHRGLTPGFLDGVQHQRLVRGRAPRHRGLYLGTVTGVNGTTGRVALRLEAPLKRGDGVVFDCGQPEQREEGGAVFDVLDARGRRLTYPDGSAHGVAAGQIVQLVFGGRDAVDTGRVQVGDLVWKTKDGALEASLRSTFDDLGSSATRKLPIHVTVSGALGTPLVIALRDPTGRCSSAASDKLLQPAARRPMTRRDLLDAVGQLGDNALGAADVDTTQLDLEQGLFLPASELKATRRRAVEQLMAQLQGHQHAASAVGLAEGPVLPDLLAKVAAGDPLDALVAVAGAAADAEARAPAAAAAAITNGLTGNTTVLVVPAPPQDGAAHSLDGEAAAESERLSSHSNASSSGSVGSTAGGAAAGQDINIRVLCRSPKQVDAALRVGWLREVVLDFLEVHGLKEAVAAVRAAGKRVVVALPRILKPDEQRLLQFYLRLGADALLVRGTGVMQQLQELGGPGAPLPGSTGASNGSGSSSSSPAALRIPALEGDFSLNTANVLTAALLLDEGLSRITPTHDLNARQMCALARGLGRQRASSLEVIIHQHLPIFHTEHCVFCRFLSDGNSYKDCGHPCEAHTVHLRDGQGKDHLVLADMGCRNTVFNAQAQSGAYYVQDFLRAGYRNFRIELVDEPAEYVEPLLQRYCDMVLGTAPAGQLWRWLRELPDANGRQHGVGSGSLETHQERTAKSLRPSARRR